MFSVRFHLGRGLHYKHWQIKDLVNKDVQIEYIDPYRYQLYLVDCELICNERTARRVYQKGIKDVCGWIKCRDLYVGDPDILVGPDTDCLPMLKFNPIVDPNWRVEGMYGSYNGKKFASIVTSGRHCYIDEMCECYSF
jgi:hypothetical protein